MGRLEAFVHRHRARPSVAAVRRLWARMRRDRATRAGFACFAEIERGALARGELFCEVGATCTRVATGKLGRRAERVAFDVRLDGLYACPEHGGPLAP